MVLYLNLYKKVLIRNPLVYNDLATKQNSPGGCKWNLL